MRLVIGTAVHNNLVYTQSFLNSIITSHPYEVFIVNNGSYDGTEEWLKENGYNFANYKENMGFSYAYNNAMDYALTTEDSLLIFAGNDTVFHRKAIDYMVEAITTTDYEMFCGFEILNKIVLEENREAIKDFKYPFSFDVAEGQTDNLTYNIGGMNHSCMIRQKSVFDRVGYYDVNFYPAYFEDNDYARRCDLFNIKYGTVTSALFYHFWSRTIKEGGLANLNSSRFDKNKQYYISKWGGVVGREIFEIPFSNIKFGIERNSGDYYDSVKISTRDNELSILKGFGVI